MICQIIYTFNIVIDRGHSQRLTFFINSLFASKQKTIVILPWAMDPVKKYTKYKQKLTVYCWVRADKEIE